MNIWQRLLTLIGIKKQNTQWVATPEIEAAVTKFESSLTTAEGMLNTVLTDAAALSALVPEIAPEINALIAGVKAGEVTIGTFEAAVNAAISAATGKPFPAPTT